MKVTVTMTRDQYDAVIGVLDDWIGAFGPVAGDFDTQEEEDDHKRYIEDARAGLVALVQATKEEA